MRLDLETIAPYAGEGGEETIRSMNEDELLEIGRKTYDFVRSVLRDPVYRKMFELKKAELAAAGYFDRH